MTLKQLSLQLQLPNGQVEPIVLDYRRAVLLETSKTLLISDLHWGKGETFRRYGIPIPQNAFEADLQRLSALIRFHSPSRILILGDLIHGKAGLTAGLLQAVCDWRASYPISMTLVAGNHDRHVQNLADSCGIDVTYSNLREDGFLFSHHPIEEAGFYTWCGHIHPAILLTSPTDNVRLPCFHLTNTQGTLPAFSYFTGGYNVKPRIGDQVVAISGDSLIPL
jgi:DNA ligase-associated metallophosphoesterase